MINKNKSNWGFGGREDDERLKIGTKVVTLPITGWKSHDPLFNKNAVGLMSIDAEQLHKIVDIESESFESDNSIELNISITLKVELTDCETCYALQSAVSQVLAKHNASSRPYFYEDGRILESGDYFAFLGT